MPPHGTARHVSIERSCRKGSLDRALSKLLHEAQQARDEEHGFPHERHEQEDGNEGLQEGHERFHELPHGEVADGHTEDEAEPDG